MQPKAYMRAISAPWSTYLQYTVAIHLHSCEDLVYVSYNLVRQPLDIFGRHFDLLFKASIASCIIIELAIYTLRATYCLRVMA